MVRSTFKAFVITAAMAGAFTLATAPAADAKVVIKVQHGHHWGGHHGGGYYHYKPYRHYGHGYGGYYGGYGGCFLKPKRVWTPYGWAWTQRTVCY